MCTVRPQRCRVACLGVSKLCICAAKTFGRLPILDLITRRKVQHQNKTPRGMNLYAVTGILVRVLGFVK